MGNISLTNSLAEQGLKKACSQGMFQVDDELIQPPQSLEENVSLAFFQGYDFLKDNKWWLLAGIVFGSGSGPGGHRHDGSHGHFRR